MTRRRGGGKGRGGEREDTGMGVGRRNNKLILFENSLMKSYLIPYNPIKIKLKVHIKICSYNELLSSWLSPTDTCQITTINFRAVSLPKKDKNKKTKNL